MSTKIDWCDTVWNPVWGCLHNCPFCYARRFAGRFYRKVAKKNNLSPEEMEKLREFRPVFLSANYRRKFRKRERIVFVNSMSDPAFWEQEWIEKVFERIKEERDRVFLFLTKNPDVYKKFPSPLPINVWLGVSATNTTELLKRGKELLRIAEFFPTGNLFVSIEPIKEQIDTELVCDVLEHFGWVVVGPETGSVNKEHRKTYGEKLKAWVGELKNFCSHYGIPFFTKEACAKYGIELHRKFPIWR